MKIDKLDHLVLTVKDVKTTIDFYTNVLGMEPVQFGAGRSALLFGSQKINLHQQGNEFDPKAQAPTPGSADLCFITLVPIADVVSHLAVCGVPVIEGPVQRTGATGPINSVYLRDPDMNLIEISNRLNTQSSNQGVSFVDFQLSNQAIKGSASLIFSYASTSLTP